ncbi:winged helix-turn-helix domain-containing protein [Actinoplanes sp. CA-142083]|uniref:winged helix-turn-helix domain-containing protein n=1 Tax=Actinoplanes sp. CA-142083 TaxID=3239903 RepID=UPI003D91B577
MLVRVLGPLEVSGAGGPVAVAGHSQRTVLALLALHAGRPVGVTALMDALWPEGPPAAARNSLQSHVARLRAALGTPGVITLEPAGYRLAVERAAVDALRFEDLLKDDAAVAEAVGLWRGEPLPEFTGEPFRGFAARLRGMYREALARGAAGDLLGRLVEEVHGDASWEAGACALAEAYARGGRRGEALEALRRHADAVVERLGIDPSERVRALQVAVLRGELEPAPHARVALRPRPGAQVALRGGGLAGRVPMRFSSFVGREREVRQLAELLAEPGLVTVTGPGGVGKTRLVAETVRAGRLVAWVDAADVGPEDLVEAVAVAVGARIGPMDEPMGALSRAAEGFSVVVLDNCEHVVEMAGLVVSALNGLRVVVTSQERLRVDGEKVLALAPLGEEAAARLFGDRAGVVAEPEAVGEIVRRLDLLPLAIELAATQAAALGVTPLRERLDDRLDLLVRGARGGDVRHRTLRAVVDWSFGLLERDGQVVLRRLAVFAGAFTVGQAEAVVGDAVVSREKVAAVLASLVERSLVVRHGPGRFRLLETVRAYAGEGLREDRAATVARHAAAMVAAAEKLDREMHGRGQAEAVRRIDGLLPDLRLAFARGSMDVRVRLAAAMYRYGYRCQQYEVLRWGRAAIGVKGHPRTGVALAAAATHAWGRGELEEARSLALAAEGCAPAYEVLGDVALVSCDASAAISYYSAISGSPTLAVSALVGEALVHAWSGEAARAVDLARSAVDISDLSGNPSARAEARYGLGEALGDVEPARALALLAEAASIAAETDDRLFRAAAETAAVAIRSRHGDPVAALSSFRDVLALWRRAGNDTLQTAALRNLVVLLVRVGEDETAVLVDAALPPAGVYPAEAERLERARRAAGERLGAERVNELRRLGAHLTPGQVVEAAARAIEEALARS